MNGQLSKNYQPDLPERGWMTIQGGQLWPPLPSFSY
jgi:hypothetical protein